MCNCMDFLTKVSGRNKRVTHAVICGFSLTIFLPPSSWYRTLPGLTRLLSASRYYLLDLHELFLCRKEES